MKGSKTFSLKCISEYRTELMGLAILWIMLFHSYRAKIYFFDGVKGLEWIGKIIGFGNMGCEIFLLASAIGLTFSFRKGWNLKDFYTKRFLRLLVPTWIIWGPYWIGQSITGEMTVKELILSLTTTRVLVDGVQSIWFITLMVGCYLAFPLMYIFINYGKPEANKKQGLSALADPGALVRTVILIIVTIAFIMYVREAHPAFYQRTEIALNRVPVFIAGIYLGKLVADERNCTKKILPIMALLLALGYYIIVNSVFTSMWGRLFYAIPSICLVFILSEIIHTFPVEKILYLLRRLGAMSLEVYCAHNLFLRMYCKDGFIYSFTPGSVPKFLGLLVLAVILAYLVDLAERRIIKNKGVFNG